MRKFLFIVAAVMMLPFVANAQTVQGSKIFDNTFVGVYGGATTTNLMTTHRTFFWNGAKDIVKGVRPVAAVEFGKYVTPVVGFSVEGQAIFNTTKSSTFVDQSNVIANAKVNLSNLIGGYPGQPRFVEVVAVPGIGWGHNYGHDYDIPHFDKNYLTYKVGAEVNFNVADNWQINVRPSAIWWNYNNMLKFHSKNLQAQVLVGATYKFGNFKNCPYTVTAAEYNALQNKVKELQDALAKKPTEVEKEVVKEVIVEKVKEAYKTTPLIVTFKLGSSKLSPVEKLKIERFAEEVGKDAKIRVIGSADTATGTERINNKLSQARAEIVEKTLKDAGVKEVSTETKLDIDKVASMSRSAVVLLVVE